MPDMQEEGRDNGTYSESRRKKPQIENQRYLERRRKKRGGGMDGKDRGIKKGKWQRVRLGSQWKDV